MSRRRITRADRALTEMQEHLTWLRKYRAIADPERQLDIYREVGVTECMDVLRRHGARLVEAGEDV